VSATEHAGNHPGGLQRHDLGGTVWWHDAAPTAETLAVLGRDVGLPAAVLDAAVDAPPRPHRLRCGDWRIWVLAPVAFRPATAQVVVGHLLIATDGARVVTCGGLPPGRHAEEFVARVARRRAGRPGGAEAVVDAIETEVLDADGQAIRDLDDAIEDIEEAVFAPQRGSHAERIYRLKREVHKVRRCVGPLPELFDAAHWASELGGDAHLAEARPALHAQALRLVEQVAHGDSLLDSVLAAHQAQVTIQQNDDMRRISAWVAIVAAPTAIASIYGMNFRHMPELGSPFGYPIALLVMLGVCIVLYRLFRRSGWL
jgi:magnesium transporter